MSIIDWFRRPDAPILKTVRFCDKSDCTNYGKIHLVQTRYGKVYHIYFKQQLGRCSYCKHLIKQDLYLKGE